jgi:beta-glucosidase
MKNSFKLLGLLILFSTRVITAQTIDESKIESQITTILNQLTLEEKISMIHANSSFTSGGVSRLNIPELVTSDGPHGVRPEHGRDWILDKNGKDSSTYLPVGITLASTWNTDLGFQFGAVLGREAKYRGKNIILGPGINIIRTPLNGRNFEYMSEDPYLTSKMAIGYIKGVQQQGISACVKHFLANNQEFNRDGINVNMSERALREIYLPGFKSAVVDAEVNAVMGAYNKFRGEYCTYNNYLVNGILKGEWKFKGIMMSDWGAIHSTKEALLGGADLEMGSDIGVPPLKFPDFYFAKPALKMIQSGEVSKEVLDDKVRRILRVMLKTNMLYTVPKEIPISNLEHASFARKVAEQGIVLLKNKGYILPLSKSKTIALIGANAIRENAMGGGSSQVLPRYEITPFVGLRNLIKDTSNIVFSAGYSISKQTDNKLNDLLVKEAVAAAKKADVAIVVGGWTHGFDYSIWADNKYDAEGQDKPDMKMPFNQDSLISEVLKVNPNTIVVLFGGGALDISKWEKKVKAILYVGYPGQEGGNALARIIYGDVNPSGKLTFSWPKHLEDSPAHKIGEYPGKNLEVNYKDDIYVGYRYFDTYKVKPQFSFGHGLSYSSYTYDNLEITKEGNVVKIQLDVKNSSKVDGADIVQVYVRDKKSEEPRPFKELKAFNKVFLKAGEQKKITFSLNKEDFSYFNSKNNVWVLEPGIFDILIGSSSNKISLKDSVYMQ